MPSQPIVRMEAITKQYDGVMANNAVDFNLLPGEVHTLLGENGAGKSTLMHILSGMVPPDSGSIEVNGRPVRIRRPHDSLKLGIGMVYQHFALVPNLTVMENIALGSGKGLLAHRQRAEFQLSRILKDFGLSLPFQETISNLSVGMQQRVEIAKALFHDSDVLILDEPTSVLTPLETDELFKTMDTIRRRRKAVVFITHKLNEALRISDRISILKAGEMIAELSGEDLRRMDETDGYQKIFDVMFGGQAKPETTPPTRTSAVESVLSLDRVVCVGPRGDNRLNQVSLDLRRGEVFGIAGVDGNGQKELAEIIAGQRKISSGRLLLNGSDITHLNGAAARTHLGISHITDERMQEGCALPMSVEENLILRRFKESPFARRKILKPDAIRRYAEGVIREFDIKAAGPKATTGNLSGGNIQKLILARELTHHPSVLVCNKPTQGLDAMTTRYVQERIGEECDGGTAVLLISTDMDELLSCSDRIGVLFNGELIDVLNRHDATHETIGKRMLGFRS